jgi:DNA recombination-dependent growth factor C
MPVLRGAVTFSRFRAQPAGDAPSDSKRWLTKALRARAFEPIDRRSEDERAAGFVELENTDSTEFSPGAVFYGEYALMGYRIDQIKVPGPVLKAELEKWATAFAKEQGRAPSRAEKATSRANLRQMLRTRAVPLTRVHDVSWNLKTNQVQVWAASRRAVEEILTALETGFSVKLEPLVPAAVAARAGIAEAALGPTPELVGVELPAVAEVSHGA